MSGLDYIVPPLGWDKIGRIADRLREDLARSDEPNFPIMTVVEKVLDQQLELFRLEIGSRADMAWDEGRADPSGEYIELREDVYLEGWAGNGRARFTVAHELGHWMLHTGMGQLKRMVQGQRVQAYRRAEPQANQFAAELLMPRRFFAASDTTAIVKDRHGVSSMAAQNRLKFLRKEGLI